MSWYDGNGNEVGVTGDVGISDLSFYDDGSGTQQRQAHLTYSGKTLYPINHEAQRLNKIKMYDGGVMLALGDSYTSMNSGRFSNFATAHGLVCDNLGYASSTIAGSADGTTVGYHAFWKRLDDHIAEFPITISGTQYALTDVKLITVMGGANDWWTVNESIDRLGDPTSTDKEQLYGACKYIFETLYETFPNADIVVILQPSNANGDNNNYAMWLKEGIVRQASEMYSIPTCDCCFDWHSPVNPTDLATYWNSDMLHLSSAGYDDLFARLEKTVNTLKTYRAS